MSTRVIHVTESLASGVMDLLATITRRQADAGAEVLVLFAARPDTPSDTDLRLIFDERVVLRHVAKHDDSTLKSALAIRAELLRELRGKAVDAVHLHSTVAGLIGRFGAGLKPYRAKTFYSPHGFGFLRSDLPAVVRAGLRRAERLASRRSTLILSTESELELARKQLGDGRMALVVNGISTESLPRATANSGDRLRVGMAGRVVHQKAPWVFADIADELSDLADFTWFGGGSPDDTGQWLEGTSVNQIEWIPLAELREQLSHLDVFLFPTLWEGMPLSLIEAQCIGVPAVATRIPGNADIVVDGETGFLCDSREELLERTKQLLSDPELRARMSVYSLETLRGRFDDRRIGEELLSLYSHGSVEAEASKPRE